MPRHSEQTLSAIKQAVDIVSLVGESLTIHRSGSKFKALCPFHDDHNPSMELNPDRQSYKCWSCGAGGDIFDFVKDYERVDFPEALRMLADRAGITLEGTDSSSASGPSKGELFEVTSWAEATFADALTEASEGRSYLLARGISADSMARFRLGYAPETRDWLTIAARRAGIAPALLERVGLIARSEDKPIPHERFRGRVIFPIHDTRGRVLGFGGRILPSIERTLADSGRRVAKYLNSPETPLFQKRRVLYGGDLARSSTRAEGWVAVVEGYTDVIAAHQVGLTNVVGTLGTALGDDHVTALRRMTDRAVLVFDGDEAGQKAADRSLELFLGHEVDVRVLALPEAFDPCDFLLSQGAEPFRAMVDRAIDPLTFAIGRAGARFDLESMEGSRQAAEYVLAVFARIPSGKAGAGLDLKIAKGLDTLSRKLSIPVADLKKRLSRLRQPKAQRPSTVEVEVEDVSRSGREIPSPPKASIRPIDLNPIDRELIKLVLNEPKVVATLITRVTVGSLLDAPLQAILQVCYDLFGEGVIPTFERVTSRLDDRELRALAAGLQQPVTDPNSGILENGLVVSVEERLSKALVRFDDRERKFRLKDVQAALAETDPKSDPVGYQALQRELFQLLTSGRTRKSHAS